MVLLIWKFSVRETFHCSSKWLVLSPLKKETKKLRLFTHNSGMEKIKLSLSLIKIKDVQFKVSHRTPVFPHSGIEVEIFLQICKYMWVKIQRGCKSQVLSVTFHGWVTVCLNRLEENNRNVEDDTLSTSTNSIFDSETKPLLWHTSNTTHVQLAPNSTGNATTAWTFCCWCSQHF